MCTKNANYAISQFSFGKLSIRSWLTHWARVGFVVLIIWPSTQVSPSTHNMWEHPSSDKSWVAQKQRSPTPSFLIRVGSLPQSHHIFILYLLCLSFCCNKYPLLIRYPCFAFPFISFWKMSTEHGSTGKGKNCSDTHPSLNILRGIFVTYIYFLT